MFMIDSFNGALPTTHYTMLFPENEAKALRKELRDRACRLQTTEGADVLYRFVNVIATDSPAQQPKFTVREGVIASVGTVVTQWGGKSIEAHCAVTMPCRHIQMVQRHCLTRADGLANHHGLWCGLVSARIRLLRKVGHAKQSDFIQRVSVTRSPVVSPERGMSI